MSLRVQNLSHRYPHAEVASFTGLSLGVEAGTLLLIAGPSGAGKTTLLRAIALLESGVTGEVFVGDERFTAGNAQAMGFVFQTHELFPHLTVLANCMLPLTTGARLSKEAARATAERCLEELGVRSLAERHPDFLSHGQRQRVAIARALVLSPKVLLLDEPSASLDPLARRELLGVIASLKRRGLAVLVVSHDLQLLEVAEYMGVFAEQRLVEIGPTREIIAAPQHPTTAALLAAARGPMG